MLACLGDEATIRAAPMIGTWRVRVVRTDAVATTH
jgi:hypothetical protein